MATCDINQLLEDGKCFACLTPGQLDIIELQLLCEILAAGGGGGGGSQTPWTSNIDGGAFSLSNVTDVSATTFNGVKVYRALLTQSGTAAPSANVLENSLGGTLVWGRNGEGDYSATLAGAFPDADKVWLSPSQLAISSGGAVIFTRTDSDSLSLTVEESFMLRFPVEILVYP